ncbi:uncharacterized protein LOC127662700 [Xyrauchen texanus]|uniref:uncharacterized protein LOC127662700 n=1 Tax=Xyrauchen texanus TaxID=154827 RepID=UPI0022422848|nr:uncharacterized protein LOC127662700 [Xyrauchen texanus]
MRFESKHTYFKQCARKLHNFKNLSSTLAERHQLLQAYLHAGNVFPPVLQVGQADEFNAHMYNFAIQEAVRLGNLTGSIMETAMVTYKGTTYKKGMSVVLDVSDGGYVLGKIALIIVCQEKVDFVSERHQSVPVLDLGVHCVQHDKSQKDLADTNNVHPAQPEKVAKTDSYGCINWQPSQLPEGETIDSLHHKKEELKLIFSQEGPSGTDRVRVNDLMVLTYASQRSAINSTPSLSVHELKREWPFLFMNKFLMQHFTSLTGIELDERLRECIAGKGRRVLQFFKTQFLRWTKEVKTVLADIERLQGENMDSTIAVILLMMTFFREKDDAIFLLADVTSTHADAEAQLSLPTTPRIIMLGDSILTSKNGCSA